MKVETALTLFGTAFVGLIAAIYWFTSYEAAGSTLLLVGAAMYCFLTGYLYLQARRIRGGPPRPEDLEDGTVADAETPVGYFPAASVWPPAIALGAVVAALGLVYGYWFFVVASILLIGAVIGYAIEAQARPDPAPPSNRR
jgi:hypothetical protein